jgi:cell division protein FtsI (penicillin-binding protein 3)
MLPPYRDPEVVTVKRVRIIARIALLWVALLFCRLIHLQVFSHDEYVRLAQQQQEKQIEIQAPRGAIYDRNREPLAMSLPVDSVCVNPVRVPDIGVASQLLARTLELDPKQLEFKIKLAQDNHRGFLWVKRKITPEESERLRSYNFDWVEYRQESRRFYPGGQLAAHVVGSVDHEERGNVGLERSLNDDLEGHPGVIKLSTDVKQRVFEETVFTEPQAGKNITLTIDGRIQHVAERALAKAVIDNHCTTGSLVVMNPHTGEILAMANYPTFDPNEPLKPGESLEDRVNLAVSVPFEPGSVFKVITLSAALEATDLQPGSIIQCGNGIIRLAGRVIHDHNSYSTLSMADVLAKSSNIGAINVGLRVGQEKLYEYVRRFGFGKSTGLPLPAESTGVVRPLSQWQGSSIGSVAMGHEVSSTTVQLAQACSVIANGGRLVSPRLIMSRQRPGGPVEPEPAAGECPMVISPANVNKMISMMEGVVLHGTGTNAKLDHFTSAGKTGSAQIFDLETHQYTHHYNASFMGFAPATMAKPRVVVVVTLNGAARYGGAVAAPVFREVTTAALRILDVPKDLPDGFSVEEQEDTHVTDDSALAELNPDAPALAGQAVEGRRGVSLLSPVANTAPVVQGPQPAGPQEVFVNGPRVPDFRGKSLRAVLEESARAGVPVEYSGNGIARAQWPAAGVILPTGERVRVQFAR